VAQERHFLRGAKSIKCDTSRASPPYASDNYNATASAFAFAADAGNEFMNEEGMTEMVGGELDFVSIGGKPRQSGHDSGVADENVDPREVVHGEDFVGGGTDRGEVGEIAGEKSDGGGGSNSLALGEGGRGGFGVTSGEDDVRWVVLREMNYGAGAKASRALFFF